MLNLNDFFYFVQVVDRGGFTAAGRTLGMPKSTLSYRMQQLESELGVRLLNRTSRHFAPTQAGEEFYKHALSMVRAAEEAEALARQRVKVPSGVIRFTAAIGTAQFALREILMNFMQDYPRISLVEHVTSRQVDLLAENIDVAIRAHSGALPDSTLVRRSLATAPWILVAGTEALKKSGFRRRLRTSSSSLLLQCGGPTSARVAAAGAIPSAGRPQRSDSALDAPADQ